MQYTHKTKQPQSTTKPLTIQNTKTLTKTIIATITNTATPKTPKSVLYNPKHPQASENHTK